MTSASTDVLCDGVAVAASPPRSRGTRPAHSSAADDHGYEQWPYLDEEVLVASRSHKVCLTCHFFRHHAGVNCIPVLTCSCTRVCWPMGSTSPAAAKVGPTT